MCALWHVMSLIWYDINWFLTCLMILSLLTVILQWFTSSLILSWTDPVLHRLPGQAQFGTWTWSSLGADYVKLQGARPTQWIHNLATNLIIIIVCTENKYLKKSSALLVFLWGIVFFCQSFAPLSHHTFVFRDICEMWRCMISLEKLICHSLFSNVVRLLTLKFLHLQHHEGSF